VTSVNRARKAVRSDLLVVVLAEAALVVALHWIGSGANTVPLGALVPWLQTSDPTVVLVSLARLVGLGMAYWLLTTTVLYAFSYHLGPASLTRALHWVTLPVVRRVVQGVTAMSLTGASLIGPTVFVANPALAQQVVAAQTSPTTPSGTADQGTTDSGPYSPDAAGWPSGTTANDFWLPTGLTASSIAIGAQAGTQNYTVVKGDHFWNIAKNHLQDTLKHKPTEDEVAHYWVKLVAANRATIRSGNPDLIYPQEVVKLPPVLGD
jgi:hypothetical protein